MSNGSLSQVLPALSRLDDDGDDDDDDDDDRFYTENTPLSSRHTALLVHVILNQCLAFYGAFSTYTEVVYFACLVGDPCLITKSQSCIIGKR